jgi:hypothetical protein
MTVMSDSLTRYSYLVQSRETINIQFPVATLVTWDAFWRAAYQKADVVIQNNANALLARGNITMEEARQLVDGRNNLALEMREPLSPFGKFYSETLKPAASLPTLESLLEEKFTIEAVLTSVGKSRAVVNKLAFIGRVGGPAGIVLQVVSIFVVVEKAPPGHKAEVATEEFTGAVMGVGVGTVGMWGGGVVAGAALAGATWAAAVVSPSLAIPLLGEAVEGGAILIGGIAGGLWACWNERDDIKYAAHASTQAIWRHLPIEWKQ